MAKYNALIHAFNVGELSKSGLARVDQKRVALGAETQENLFPKVDGTMFMRPGTKYLGLSSTAVSGGSIVTNVPRLIPFTKSIDSAALVELQISGTTVVRKRVWKDDSIITFSAVTSTVGAFSTYTTATTGDATVTAASTLVMQCPNQGGTVIAKKQVTTSSTGTRHALSIIVASGSVNFRVGSTDGDDDYISSTTLSEGTHILSFTPTGSYWVRFFTKSKTQVTVTSCSVFNSTAADLSILTPWTPADNIKVRYDQSLDVVYLAVDGYIPRKIERRSDYSWSLVKFLPQNGPFMTFRSDSDVKLKPTATRGNTTLTADQPFFDDTKHTGVLFRLTHDKLNATYGLGAAGEYTKPFRQTGIVYGTTDDRNFSVTVSGTWVGTINIQRSFDNELTGFSNLGADITANGTTAVAGNSADDNAIVWYRVIFTTYTSGSAQIAVSYDGYGWTGICRVTGVTNSTTASVEVLSDFSDVTYTDIWREGEWNAVRGYPTAVCLFDGRLWWARKDRFWGSESDSYESYDETVTGDSASIQRAVATGGSFSDVKWMLPLQRLIFGTSGQEVSARSSSFDEPLTPNNITLKDASSQGSADVSPVKIDSKGVFVHRSGRKIYQLAYSIDSNDYVATDLTRYNDEICISGDGYQIDHGLYDINEIAVQRQPQTYIWCVRSDGVVPVLIFDPSQEIMGWFRYKAGRSYGTSSPVYNYQGSDDRIVSVCVLPGAIEDSVYFIVERAYYDSYLGQDAVSFYIEKLERHTNSIYKKIASNNPRVISNYNGLYQCDSYVTGTVVATDDTTLGQFMVSSAAAHIAGYNSSTSNNSENLVVIGAFYDSSGSITHYGPISSSSYDNQVDANGNVYFSSDDSNHAVNLIGDTVTIGLPYYGKYKSSKLAYGAQSGTSLLAPKRVSGAGLLMSNYNHAGIQIGSDLDIDEAMDDLPAKMEEAPVNTSTTLTADSDSDLFPFPSVWDTDSRVCIKVKPGYTATFNNFVASVETNEK